MEPVETNKEASLLKTGQELFGSLKKPQKSLFSKKEWYGKLMRWTISSPSFKTPLFRFVDVFPVLKTPKDVLFFLNEYLGADSSAPWLLRKSLSTFCRWQGKFLSNMVSEQMREMSHLFIVGEDLDSAWPVLTQMRKEGYGYTLDLLGEAVLSEKEAGIYQNRYQQSLDQLREKTKTWEPQPFMDEDEKGRPLPKVNISVKISSLDSQIQNVSHKESKERLKQKLRVLFQKAVETGAFVNVDMEQYVHKELTLCVFRELIAEEEFKNYPHFGLVIQAYLRDSLQDLKKLLPFVQKRGTAVTIRLVKGAYWDYERIHSRQNNWPCPVYLNKWESDMNFEVCANFILKAYPFLRLALGTHNIRSLTYALHRAQELGQPKKALEIQTLYGMAGGINRRLAERGWRVRQYCPIGLALPGMAYLVRRLLENTANESFIRQDQSARQNIPQLIKAPGPSQPPSQPQASVLQASVAGPAEGKVNPPVLQKTPSAEFQNTAPLDFSLPSHRKNFQKALKEWEKRLPLSVPVIIDNKEIMTARTFKRENPSRTSQTVAVVSQADKPLCEQAIQRACQSFASDSQTPVRQRLALFRAVADKMEARRYSLSALQVLEVGKTWAGADADVCEAIDFCRYYATEMERLASARPTAHVLGEESFYSYHPRGLALVIAPWNFPLAILTGMSTACLITGNTALIKPAEQSSATAYELMKLLIECGLPQGTAQFLPGRGEETGAFLAEQKETELIAFTGSKETGTAILEKANQVFSRKNKLKRCIVEMGGKNAIIVDESADLDIAVAGVVESAFGFQGQKCSACSRVIVAQSIEKLFTERLLPAVQSLITGPAEKPESRIGPVVDAQAFQKIRSYIEKGKKTARLISKESALPAGGYFISPAVFSHVPLDSPLLKEEIFGPVLAIVPFEGLDQAIDLANNTEFALTAGFYSRSPSRIKQVQQKLQAGNIYINRSCTGALVKRHPFGGFKMSGLGHKAGGPDYLIQFMNPKVVTENTVRQGFSPHLL